MAFNSLQYPVFLAVVVILYYRFGRRGQNLVMLAAGSIFFALFDVRFLACVYVSIVFAFAIAQAMDGTAAPRSRQRLLAVAIAGHLGLLGFVKYCNFFLDSLHGMLDRIGIAHSFAHLDILLPVGISFYTFQTLGYLIAVHRREVPAERDLLTFAVFVAWFPLVVAGPIERASTLLPQLQDRRRTPDGDSVGSALLLILTGLFKKVVIADGVAAYVNGVYGAPSTYRWSALVLATVAFSIQVYGDFSGYTDIARGTSRLLGVELRRNFEQPFLSRDIREFWTRWHTSLSWWFLEFVGRPLGGVGRGPHRAAVTVLVIFALIGLWHGPASHFVLWGFLNGVLVVIWRQWFPVPKGRHPMKVRGREAPTIAATFGLFCVGAVFFRADRLSDAMTVLGHVVSLQGGRPGPAGGGLVPIVVLLVLVLDLDERARRIHTIERLRIRASLGSVAAPAEAVAESAVDRFTVLRCVGVAAMVLGIVVFSGGAPEPFIYRQF